MNEKDLKKMQIEDLINTYNECIDKLEELGYNVGNKYDGHISLKYYSNSKEKFYIDSAY